MKAINRRLLAVILGIFLTFALVITSPVLARAEGTEQNLAENFGSADITAPTIKMVSLIMDDFQIDLSDADTSRIYSLGIRMEGSEASSFSFKVYMPEFIIVDSVHLSHETSDGLLESSIDDGGRSVAVAYSSSVNRSNVTILTVNFRLAYVEEVSGEAYFNDYVFTNTDVENINVVAHPATFAVRDGAIMGDADGNGVVELADIMAMLRSIVDPRYSLGEMGFTAADINKDGMVNIYDCQYVQNYLAGLIGSLDDVTGGNGGGEETFQRITIAEALEKGNELEIGMTTDLEYAICGRLIRLENDIYGNAYISDGEYQIYIYGIVDAAGNRYDRIENKPMPGDMVELRGQIKKFQRTDTNEIKIEMVNAVLMMVDPCECEHINTVELLAVEPTCTTNGTVEVVCQDCDTMLNSYECPAWGHSYFVTYDSTPASCADGWTGTGVCLDCGESVQISGTNHDMFIVENILVMEEEQTAFCGLLHVYVGSCACGQHQTLQYGWDCADKTPQETQMEENGIIYEITKFSCTDCNSEIEIRIHEVATELACITERHISFTAKQGENVIYEKSIVNHAENHTYSNGACTSCEAACPHNSGINESETFLSAYGLCGPIFVDELCAECGATVRTYLKENVCQWTITEWTENDGHISVCSVCGARRIKTLVSSVKDENCIVTNTFKYEYEISGSIVHTYIVLDTSYEPQHNDANSDGICDDCNADTSEEISIEEANRIGLGLSINMMSNESYTVTGTVLEILNSETGRMRITDDNNNVLYIYSFMDPSTLTVNVGDSITVRGKACKYTVNQSMTIEMIDAEVVTLTDDMTLTSIEEFNAIASALKGGSATTAEKYVISGTIIKIVNATYGNMWIADENGNEIYIYGLNAITDGMTVRYDSMTNKPIVGDRIVIKGAITKYFGSENVYTIEIKSAELVSVTFAEKAEITDVINTGNNMTVTAASESHYTVTGTISRIENATYGKMYLIDENKNELFIYGFIDPETVAGYAVGDTITVQGIAVKYMNRAGEVVIEMKDAALVELTEDAVVTPILDFNTAASNLTGTSESSPWFEITGTVKEDPQATYGNLYLIDGEGNEVYVYGLYDEAGTRYDALTDKPAAGDVITIRGRVSRYLKKDNTNQLQIKNAVLIEIVERAPITEETQPDDTATGGGSTTTTPDDAANGGGTTTAPGDTAAGGGTTTTTTTTENGEVVTENGKA